MGFKKYWKKWFSSTTNESENTDSQKIEESIYNKEIDKFITNVDHPEAINTALILDFLLDKSNPIINRDYLEFCTSILCIENIEFLYNCKEMKQADSYDEIRSKCLLIYWTYIDTQSSKQINLNSKTVETIQTVLKINEQKKIMSPRKLYTTNMKRRLKHVFDDAMDEIRLILIGNTIIKFISKKHITTLTDVISESSRLSSRNSLRLSSSKSKLSESDRIQPQ